MRNEELGIEVLSKSMIWLTAPMQQRSKSEAIG